MRKIQKQGIGVLLFLVLVLSLSIIPSGRCLADTENGWDDGYYYKDGKKQKSTWVKDKGDKFYVNSNGRAITGWKKIGGHYHYFNEPKGLPFRNSSKRTGACLTSLGDEVLTIGLDMSQWQGNVNWDKIKEDGIDFVILRVGYGKYRFGSKNFTLDPKFNSYVAGAKRVGIPIGIYFYTYATTPKQAQEEAEYVIKQLDGIDVSFPVAFDIEDSAIIEKTNTATRTEMCRTFLETIAAAGYTPMLYSNRNWSQNYLDMSVLDSYEFWLANYTYIVPDREQLYNYGMWQATSTFKVNGITENTVDLNFLYKDYFSTVDPRSSAMKYGWHKENGKQYYYYRGKKLKNGWFDIAGDRYYIRNGAAHEGWATIGGEKYYFNSKGVLQTGFTKVDGKIYMLDDEGILQTETNEPGVTIKEDGSCKIKQGFYKLSSGRYIYRYSSGNCAKSTWVKKSGKKYYFNYKGYRVSGMQTIKGDTYYFSSNGVMKKGWVTYQGQKYYFKSSGKMIKGKTAYIKGKKYTFNKKGHLVK